MPEQATRGLLDTSVIIDLEQIPADDLPDEVAICAIALAELAAAPAATDDSIERARRQDRLQRTEAAFEPIPFELEAARACARVYAAVVAHVGSLRVGSPTPASRPWRSPKGCRS